MLITWTSNIQGWKAHGNPEFSNKLQTIEIYTPNRDAAGNVIGLNHEGIFYDPEALAEPIRIVRNLQRLSGLEVGDPFTFIECLPQIYPVDGRATPSSPGDVLEYEVPDMYGRPWGADLGGVSRERDGAARGRGHLQLRVSRPAPASFAPPAPARASRFPSAARSPRAARPRPA